MAKIGFAGGDRLTQVLQDIAKKAGKCGVLKVGFLEDARYPDGTQVAMVAAIQNFGAPARHIPPRPFFTEMVKRCSPNWGKALGKAAQHNGYDFRASFGMLGAVMKGQLQQSISDTNEPELSEITLMLRKMRTDDPSLVVTGKTVGEAARLLADGESYAGVSTKPLIDVGTIGGHMQQSVDFEVSDK